VGQLPPVLEGAVRDSIGKAILVAGQLPPPTQTLLRIAAEQAFLDTLGRTALVAVAILAAGSLMALLSLPARRRRVSESGESVPGAGLTLSESPNTMEAREGQPSHDRTRI
jgi:Ni,Fe-hydrogenase I small subunit